MMGIHDWNKKYEYALNRLESSGVSVSNKELVKGFVNFSLASGLSKARIERYLYVLRYFGLKVDKCFKDMVKADFVKLIGELEATDYKLWTKVTYKTVLRKFIAWVHDSDGLPSCVSWIDVSSKNVKRLPEEILTQDEVKQLIKCAKYERDKALISSLYESGCRIGELGNLLIKHVQFDKHGAILHVNGKTGQRRVRIITSAPYLAEWLNKHPDRRPNNYLWVSLPPNDGRLINYASIRRMIRKVAKVAGVTKRVNPHSFRHARATHLSNHLTEAQMKEYFGWTQDSSMASVYIHLSGRDVDNALLKINGIEVEEKDTDDGFKPVECSRCNHLNKPTDKYCSKCGLVIDVKEALEIEKLEKDKDKLLNVLINDPEVKKLLIEKARLMN